MAQSLSKILIHMIFSTKDRMPLIQPETRPKLYAYAHGVLANLGCPSIQIGGTADHIHILFVLARTISVSEAAEQIKKATSKWMKTQDVAKFSWQAGYGAFSVAESQIPVVVRYIQNQEEHHKRKSFQDEFREFLKKYNVGFDEQHIWS